MVLGLIILAKPLLSPYFESLLTNIEQGDTNGMLLIDFSKAFDLVDHLILLPKLTKYGISLAALNWFRSYLFDRNQLVQIKGFFI
jgi:hypothetical protein